MKRIVVVVPYIALYVSITDHLVNEEVIPTEIEETYISSICHVPVNLHVFFGKRNPKIRTIAFFFFY